MSRGRRFPASKLLLAAALAIGGYAALLLLKLIGAVLLVVFGGVLLAVLLSTLAGWLSARTPLSYRWAFAVLVAALAGASALCAWLLLPGLSAQVDALVDQLPRALDRLKATSQRGGAVGVVAGHLEGWLRTLFHASLSQVTNAAGEAAKAAGTALVVLFIGIYGAYDPHLYQQGLLRLFRGASRERAHDVLSAAGRSLKWWLLGRLLSMVIVGALTTIGLTVLGIPVPLLLGLIAVLLEFIPYIGPILASLPAILVALLIDPTWALYVAILYLGVQLLESYIVSPIIELRTVWLPPALTLSAQLLFGVLFGVLGVAVVAPLTAVVMVIVKLLWVRDALGEDVKLR